MRVIALAAVVLSLLVAPTSADDRLGRISFPNSGSAAAQPHFIRGVLLLHSFEFDDAAEAFREARRIDPGFAMAYWGEALTHNHPLWRYQNRDAALKVLAELGPTPEARRARAPTAREKAYLDTLDALYGQGDKPTRDRAYAAALETLARTYPDDDEARAFQSLALLGTNLEARDFAVDMRAAALAEEIFLRNQEHPARAPLHDSRVRQPGARAAWTARRKPVQPHCGPRRTRAAHDLAHLLRVGDVGRSGGVQRGLVGGQRGTRGTKEACAERARLSRLPLAVRTRTCRRDASTTPVASSITWHA